MSDFRFRPPPGGPHDPRGGYPPGETGSHRAGSELRRFLGGSPGAVLVKLIFLSLLVGAGMAMIGITPGLLLAQAYQTVRAIADLGLETFHDAGRWLLAGAVIVLPLWLLSRLFANGR
ncbi:DUF6460 domain-containing protein [uncultured Methylobacterium sp.]|jgi:hypothetical protein|uniref:DUF6460 domain-containing protein n=1 Tax=uncultured Methylobacterium sp. TaxID=157278 RepID=UPI002614698F|nr:DUF6460 domain-containing protein [uncultured Methylobacterium sp.]